MMFPVIHRPLTGWADRYVRAHMRLMNQDECNNWFVSIDAYGQLLQEYIHTPAFKDNSVKKQEQLIDDFSNFWQLPYGLGLLRLLHQYGHLEDFSIFVNTWKAFYYKTNGYFCVDITTPSLLKDQDINLVLDKLGIDKNKCILSQKISPQLLDGLVVECNGIRYDTSILGQLKQIKRNLL